MLTVNLRVASFVAIVPSCDWHKVAPSYAATRRKTQVHAIESSAIGVKNFSGFE